MKKGVCVFLAAILLLGGVGCTTSKQETSTSNMVSQTSNHVTSQSASRTESGGEQIKVFRILRSWKHKCFSIGMRPSILMQGLKDCIGDRFI